MKTFDTILSQEAQAKNVNIRGIEPFGAISYAKELEIKRNAVERFASEILKKPELCSDLVTSPQPRHYRTTSRRRVWHTGIRFSLVHGDGTPLEGPPPLEQQQHLDIYDSVEASLARLDHKTRAVFHQVVVRGTYNEFVLILTTTHVDANIVRTCRQIAAQAQKKVGELQHAWIYVDPKRSRYYLELERPIQGISSKKLFGAAAWKQTVGLISYQVGVFSFSQINLAMLPDFVRIVKGELQAELNDTVFDLYCGYGLFGAAIAKDVKKIIAIDYDKSGVDDARYNISRTGGKVEALAMKIEPVPVHRFIQSLKHHRPNVLILDPPKTGTPKGIITELAELESRRVVSVFCGVDEVRRSILEWQGAHYEVERIIPIDMFPGTAGLEVVVSFSK